jgi:hypothetical protein
LGSAACARYRKVCSRTCRSGTTHDVPALKQLFSSAFDFEFVDERGDKMAVVQNSEGFVLTLM